MLIFASNLESLPQSIGDCRELQSLTLHRCEKFREIPDTICKIKNLRALHISMCPSLKQFPSEFTGVFSNLQTINLAKSSNFRELPSTLFCPLLCTLDLSQTEVTLLPPWITTVGTLECINLELCFELVELPKGIGNLKRLAVLNIKGCTELRCMPSGIGQLTRLTQLGLFVVGHGTDDARISELGNLNSLSGELEISNLKYLKDPCDAEKACLHQKNGINNLVLDWSLSEGEQELASDVEQQQGVLSALEPPSRIESLTIKGYQGPCLPRWLMEKNNGSSYCEGTTLKQTGPCQYLSLTNLTLSHVSNLKHIRGLVKFPSLKSLELWNMASLEELWTATSGIEIQEEELSAQYYFPILSILYILDCPKLSIVKPYFPPTLKKLCLRRTNLQLLSLGNFSHMLPTPANESSSSSCLHSAVVSHLRELQLDGIVGSSSGWEFLRHHTKLETLSIGYCDDLTQVPESIRSLTSLQRLHITSCPALGMLPKWLGELCSLRYLKVLETPIIASLPQSIGLLTSLTELEIRGWDSMKLLPGAIQNLTSLESLKLTYCGALAELPEGIGQLPALRQLEIHGCSALQCLPQSIQHSTALRCLAIHECPALARRYKEGVGPDWHLISHVPLVMIY